VAQTRRRQHSYQDQVQQTAAVFETMQITDSPHQSTHQQSVDGDGDYEDDDVVFLGFEI
jgi:hypothetical protein